MRKSLIGILVIMVVALSFFVGNFKVNAQLEFCDLVPCDQVSGSDLDANKMSTSTESLIKFGASAVFSVFIGFGVFTIVKGAVTIIQGEGSEESVEKGAKAIKSVFIGVVMIFIGVFGLLILTGVLNASGILNPQVEEPDGIDLPIL